MREYLDMFFSGTDTICATVPPAINRWIYGTIKLESEMRQEPFPYWNHIPHWDVVRQKYLNALRAAQTGFLEEGGL